MSLPARTSSVRCLTLNEALSSRRFDITSIEKRHTAASLLGTRHANLVVLEHFDRSPANVGCVIFDGTRLKNSDFAILGTPACLSSAPLLEPFRKDLALKIQQVAISMDAKHLLHYQAPKRISISNIRQRGKERTSPSDSVGLAERLVLQGDAASLSYLVCFRPEHLLRKIKRTIVRRVVWAVVV